MKRAIVLSGGGAHGAYQIGVWKALRRMHIKYDLVTGTSVGAMNGALMVQKDYHKAIKLWKSVDFSLVFDEKINNDYNTKDGKKEIIKMYAKNILLNGGMDVSKLEETVEKALNLQKFYKSKIDYGLVLVEIPNLRAKKLIKKEIPKEKLKDYLMASAAVFPAFKKKQIDDKTFIDGGYYDNLPINLAIEMGAEEIIAVDLNTIGIKKRVKEKGVNITYIQPRNKLGPFLIFNNELARQNLKFGYNDTMKIYGKLDGDKYTFKHKHLEKNINKYQKEFITTFNSIVKSPNQSKLLIDRIFRIIKFSHIITGNLGATKKIINETLEYSGKILQVDEAEIYRINKYNHLLHEKLMLVEDLNVKLFESKIKNNDIKSLLDSGLIIKYIYNKLKKMEEKPELKKELAGIAIILSKEFMSALYIYVVNK